MGQAHHPGPLSLANSTVWVREKAMTTSVFPALTVAEQAFYDLIWTPMIKAGEVWLDGIEGSTLILDLPIVQDAEAGVIQTITDYAFNQLKTFVDVESLTLVDAVRQSAYEAASEQLVLIAVTQGTKSDAYKSALKTALDHFATFGKLGS